jgi:hypothetical protein
MPPPRRPRIALFALPSLLSFVASAAAAEGDRDKRRRQPEPQVVEIVDLTEDDRDPQRFAVGGQLGGGWMTNRGSKGAALADFALTFDFGLGSGGARVPWSLEPYVAFAVTRGTDIGQGVNPNRFTEIAVRLVHRFPSGGLLEHQWIGLGGGLVWTSTEASSGYRGTQPCRLDKAAAEAAGADCSTNPNIAPGALVDVSLGIWEWTVRRARWGIGARVPLQFSSNPGFGGIAFVYAQVGTAL